MTRTALVATPSRTGPPRGTPKAIPDRHNADQVAAAFTIALNLWDSTTDARPADVTRRAANYANSQLRQTLLRGPAPHLSGADVARWNQLVVRHGWTSVSTQLGGLGDNPPDTATEASRAVTVVDVDHAGSGWHYTSVTRPLYLLDLRRSGPGQPWSVAAYQVQDGGGP